MEDKKKLSQSYLREIRNFDKKTTLWILKNTKKQLGYIILLGVLSAVIAYSGVAMAQLVNVIGFAVGNLGEGDTVIIHGAEQIDDGIKEYINLQFERLHNKGGRVCYLYNNVDKMLSDNAFCLLEKADYSILGNMTPNSVKDYQKIMGQSIPPDLAGLVTNKSSSVCYIRRGFDNVVFHQDLALGLPERTG